MMYRVNTGEALFKEFSADNVEDACAYVNDHQFPNYALPRWLEVKKDGKWVRWTKEE